MKEEKEESKLKRQLRLNRFMNSLTKEGKRKLKESLPAPWETLTLSQKEKAVTSLPNYTDYGVYSLVTNTESHERLSLAKR